MVVYYWERGVEQCLCTIEILSRQKWAFLSKTTWKNKYFGLLKLLDHVPVVSTDSMTTDCEHCWGMQVFYLKFFSPKNGVVIFFATLAVFYRAHN